MLRRAIELFELQSGHYPGNEEGLSVLAEPQGHGVTIRRDIPKDPWGNPYVYRVSDGGYLLLSSGPDGKEGGGDDLLATDQTAHCRGPVPRRDFGFLLIAAFVVVCGVALCVLLLVRRVKAG